MATFITFSSDFKFGTYRGPIEATFEYLTETFGTDEDRQAAALVTQGAGSLPAADPVRVKAKFNVRMVATPAYLAWAANQGSSRDQAQVAGLIGDWAVLRRAMLAASRFMALEGTKVAPKVKATVKA